MNAGKCTWISSSIKILGHIVGIDGVKIDPEKTIAIKVRLPPTNLKQLQSFLGLCNYYRKFVKKFAKVGVLTAMSV